MQSAKSVVKLMLEFEDVRACSNCEQEFGKLVLQPGQAKTNGICRRHAYATAAGMPPEMAAAFKAKVDAAPESHFCSDMAVTRT